MSGCRRPALAALAVAFALGLAGVPGGARAAGEEPRALRRSEVGEIQTLDPQLWVYGQDGNVAMDLFQGLTSVDAAANVIPGAAAAWTVSADGLTCTYRLRPGLRWSDGTPLTSADFLYSLRRLFDPRTAAPSASLLYVIRHAREVASGRRPPAELGVRAPDPATLVIELEHPAPSLNELLVHRAMPVPRHVLEKYGREWTRAGRFVSNGPFVLEEWVPGLHVKLRRNALFWDAAAVRLDAVYHIPVEDPKVALDRYRAGDLDVVVSLPSEQLEELRHRYGAQLHLVPQIGLEYYAFNTRHAPFDDPRVRRALSMAINREALTGMILRGGEAPAYGLVPPGVADYPHPGRADFAAWSPARRSKEAAALLAAAGFGASRPLTVRLRYNSAETQRRIAVAVAAMWQPLGVRTVLENADLKTHQQYLHSGDFEVARASWLAEDRDASGFLALLDGRATDLDVAGFHDRDYEQLLDRAQATVDPAARAALLSAAESRVMQEQPLAPLYYYVGRRLIAPRVQGWTDNPRGVHLNRYLSLATSSISSPAAPRSSAALRPP